MDRHFLIAGRDSGAGIEWYDQPQRRDTANPGDVWITNTGRVKLVIDHGYHMMDFRDVTDEYLSHTNEPTEAADIEATQLDASYYRQ